MTGTPNVCNLSLQFYFELMMESYVIGVGRLEIFNNASFMRYLLTSAMNYQAVHMLITRVDIGESLRHQFHREKMIKFTIHFITYTHHETTCHIFQVRNLFHMHQACTRQYPAFLYKNGFGMHRAGGLPYRRCLKCYHVTLLLRKLPVHVSKAHTKYITRCKPVRFPVHVMT